MMEPFLKIELKMVLAFIAFPTERFSVEEKSRIIRPVFQVAAFIPRDGLITATVPRIYIMQLLQTILRSKAVAYGSA